MRDYRPLIDAIISLPLLSTDYLHQLLQQDYAHPHPSLIAAPCILVISGPTAFNQPFDTHCCHMGTAIKHPVHVPDGVKPSFEIIDIRALWRSGLSVSARMSKITNDGLTLSGTGCFIAVPIWQHAVSVKGLTATWNSWTSDFIEHHENQASRWGYSNSGCTVIMSVSK